MSDFYARIDSAVRFLNAHGSEISVGLLALTAALVVVVVVARRSGGHAQLAQMRRRMAKAGHRAQHAAAAPDAEKAEPTTDELVAARRTVGRALVLLAAACALFVSGWGMWHFFEHELHIQHWYLILPMFGLFDIAGIACAWESRTNRIAHGRAGAYGPLVWVFAVTSGFMSSSDQTGTAASLARFAAPIVAATLFELLIRGERRDALEAATGDATDDTLYGRLKRRLLARLGWLDARKLTDADAAKAAMCAKLATLAYRMHQTEENTEPRRRATAKYHAKLRVANERYRFASDPDMIAQVRVSLAAMYQSVTGTSAAAVADLNLWRAADATTPEPSTTSTGGGGDTTDTSSTQGGANPSTSTSTGGGNPPSTSTAGGGAGGGTGPTPPPSTPLTGQDLVNYRVNWIQLKHPNWRLEGIPTNPQMAAALATSWYPTGREGTFTKLRAEFVRRLEATTPPNGNGRTTREGVAA